VGVAGLLLLEVPPEVLEQGPVGLAALVSGAAATAAAGVGQDGWSLLDSGECWMLLAAQSMALGTVMVR
jgi:hypothetical protein